jgi:acyl-homoserine lactone acylase PvdQ
VHIRVAALVAALFLVVLTPGAARAQVQPYGTGDFGGFHDVLPPGTSGLANGPQLAAFLAFGQRPGHNDDQLGMYRDLMYATPGLQAHDIPKYFKDSTFGVQDADVASTISPRSDVTIIRDRRYGVPHIYGTTRDGAMFGTGYAAAQDRLFFIDVLRHLGRAQLASFAGGAAGNRAFDESQWAIAPYTEQDLQQQVDAFPRLGAEGVQLRHDIDEYVAGINQYISEAKLDPMKMPGEYAAIDKPLGPDPWKVTDIVATASLVGGIFGMGGGRELAEVRLLRAFSQRFGPTTGRTLWRQFAAFDDPDAPTTVKGKRFPYQVEPARRAPGAEVLYDPGSFEASKIVAGGQAAPGGRRPILAAGGLRATRGRDGLIALPKANSNALVVSAAKSADGHPLAVFGPQTGYFAPQILMEEDVHAPTIDARGAAFPGINMWVQLGHGRDYAWSATSAGQDIVDTFAVPLCEPDGSQPTKASTHYLFRGECLPIEVLERRNSWSPTLADSTPAGSETLRAERTKLGIVVGRATYKGKPILYTQLRSTYRHEVDSAPGFSDFNDPDKMRNAADFQHAAAKIGYTFNWLYVDDKDVAYFNSGNNPVRADGTTGQLPMASTKEWKGFDPATNLADYTPFDQHPQVIDQDVITSWNNRQAPGYAGADSNLFSSVYRSQMLDGQIDERLLHGHKLTLAGLIDAMEQAGTTDLRGMIDLPLALRVIGTPKDAVLRDAVAKLRAWVLSGAHRVDRNRDGRYDHAEAVALMDAWWPGLIDAVFQRTMGNELLTTLKDTYETDNQPNNHGDHLGSAYQEGFYGYVAKDLRGLLHRKQRQPYARAFCGQGRLASCRRALLASLRSALVVPDSRMYRGDEACKAAGRDGRQTCYDAVRFRPLGGLTQPLIPWINRPTYQQAVEVQGHRPR